MKKRLSFYVWLVVLPVLLQGCATKQAVEIPMWPSPPVQPRFIYEGTLRDQGSLGKAENSLFSILSGVTGKFDGFAKPYDVAVRNGKVVVSDSVARVLHMFDLPRRQLFRIGFRGEGALKKPLGVAMDAELNIYVADATGKRVVVFDQDGHFKKAIGKKADFDHPIDVAVNEDGSRIYVVDTGGIESMRHQVVVYDGDGKLLFTIGGRGSGPGQFNLPNQAAVAKDGSVYILDAGNFRVQVFDAEGRYLREWGKVGRNLGDLARPRGMALDKDGNVYITDGAFANFQVFNSKGELLLPVGNSGKADGPGNFILPAGIAISEKDRVFVVDQLFNKLEVIRKLSEEEGKEILLKEQ